MSDIQAESLLERPADGADDNAKRRQIVHGARKVFLSRGFDAASMGDIAKEAGVSKGTLYVYFKDKEALFVAIVEQECCTHAESTFSLDPADRDVAAVLNRTGAEFVRFLCSPGKADSLRIVIAIAERMPEIGRTFYETGPKTGIRKLAAYLKAQTEAGLLKVDDYEVAASQFLDSCQSMLFKPVLFNFEPPPSDERVAYVVGIAVRTFMAAYRA